MGKKTVANAASKISSSRAPGNTNISNTSTSSAILKSSFAPTHLQLRLFASVIQSFESQHLRIHDTSSGHLRQQHSAPVGTSITCLDWGHYGLSYREQRQTNKRKRKRLHDGQDDVVLAYGTSSSDICMYSPTEDNIVGTLKNGHEREIKDFKFLPTDNLQAWSIGADGKLVQWDLNTDRPTRTISLTETSVQSMCLPSKGNPQIICASVTPYTVHIESKDDFRIDSYDAFKSPVHTIIRLPTDGGDSELSFLAADHDRYVNLYGVAEKKILRTLVASGEVDSMTLYYDDHSDNATLKESLLAVMTKDGSIDLFSKPFSAPQARNGDIKSRRKGLTRKADASVRLTSGDTAKSPLPAFGVQFDGPNLVIVSMQSGVEPVFQKVRWQDEGSGELLFDGTKLVPRAKPASSLKSASMNGAKDMGTMHVNEARAVVTNGLAESGSQAAPLEIDSDSEGEEEEDVDGEMEQEEAENEEASELGSARDSDEEMQDAGENTETAFDNADAKEANEEASFGDLLAARHPGAISISDALPADQNALTTLPQPKQSILSSGLSLGTVLTQSLKTNDQSLLETCLHVTEEQVIQNTILRLDSSLAANLLTKLAERLADRPGRYGHLLLWVQLTMIAHGGAIASQAGVASKLRTLYQVLNERSKILPSILLLKGKLDMMSAQQSFRAQAEKQRQGIESTNATLYIEGQQDNWSSDEDEDADDVPSSRRPKRSKLSAKRDLSDIIGGPESSEDEGMPLLNGDFHSDEDEEEDELDEDVPTQGRVNGIFDNEAEVSGEEEDEDDSDSGSAADSLDEDGEQEDDDEEDSSMADFINDGEISEVEDADDVDVDDDDKEETTPPRRSQKKPKLR